MSTSSTYRKATTPSPSCTPPAPCSGSATRRHRTPAADPSTALVAGCGHASGRIGRGRRVRRRCGHPDTVLHRPAAPGGSATPVGHPCGDVNRVAGRAGGERHHTDERLTRAGNSYAIQLSASAAGTRTRQATAPRLARLTPRPSYMEGAAPIMRCLPWQVSRPSRGRPVAPSPAKRQLLFPLRLARRECSR